MGPLPSDFRDDFDETHLWKHASEQGQRDLLPMAVDDVACDGGFERSQLLLRCERVTQVGP